MSAHRTVHGGDRGRTSLSAGPRVRKDHPRVAALGELDELQSCLGVALAFLPPGRRFEGMRNELRRIQADLFVIGSLVAAPGRRPGDDSRLKAVAAALVRLDAETGAAARRSPPRGFVAPGGPPAAAFLHLARSVCRRAERGVVALAARDRRPRSAAVLLVRRGLVSPPAGVVAYLNRLSSFLFSAAAAAAR